MEGNVGFRSPAKEVSHTQSGVVPWGWGKGVMFLNHGYLPPSIVEWSNGLGQILLDAVVGTCVCSKGEPREVTSAFRSWSAMWRPHWGRRREEIRVYHFSFFLVIYPEFFSCCWLQDCEPSTLYQLDKWRNHSTLETKTLRTQQRKHNQVCNCCLLSFCFFQSSLEFSRFVADILLCTYRGCVHKWSFVFIESFL